MATQMDQWTFGGSPMCGIFSDSSFLFAPLLAPISYTFLINEDQDVLWCPASFSNYCDFNTFIMQHIESIMCKHEQEIHHVVLHCGCTHFYVTGSVHY